MKLSIIVNGVVILGVAYGLKSLLPPALISQTQSIVPSSLTLEKVQKLGELTTIRFPVQVVIPAISTREILGFPQQTKVLTVEQVYVTVGIDLQQATVENGILSLPAAGIIDAKVDVAKSKIFDSSQDPLGPDVLPELHVQAQQEALKAGIVAACNSEILLQAADQAKVVIGAIVPNLEIAIATGKPGDCAVTKEKEKSY